MGGSSLWHRLGDFQPRTDMGMLLLRRRYLFHLKLQIVQRIEAQGIVESFLIAAMAALGHHAMSAYRQERREKARARVRYWITTAIALAALVKSFLPEIRGLLALILKRPAQ